MRKGNFKSKLTSSVFITILLLYFMMKTTSPKLIFVPFLICSITMVGKQVALFLGKNKIAAIFSKLFVIGFMLFWFGFLICATYICLRDEHYGMLLCSGLFWIAGIFFAKKKLFNNKASKTKIGIPPYGIILTIISLVTLMLAGIGLLIQGILEKKFGLIFIGGFFLFGSFTFVLGALTLKGYFDKCKIDVLGLYVGIFFVVIGSGIIAMIYQQQFGFWIIIPVLMIVAGVIQVVKCIKKRE